MSTSVRPSSRKRLSIAAPTRAVWITARAKNALRRPLFIGIVSVATAALALGALIVVPQQAHKSADAMRPLAAARPDTEPTMAALTEAQRQIAAAEATLIGMRAEIGQLVVATAAVAASDTTAAGARVTADVRTRRDSLNAQNDLLTRLLSRAENAPLLASYRALAQVPVMQSDIRVKAMLDSLTEIEHERDSYTAVGGVDPVFVALTARANELGRNIVTLAEGRRTIIRRDLATIPAISASGQAVASKPVPDTMIAIAKREAARVAAAGVAARLVKERAELRDLDIRQARAEELAGIGASPSAIVAAAVVFGAMLGFGITLVAEVRRPRIADAFEVERATGVRVLGIIKPLAALPERSRRAADKSNPRYLDAGGDGHQLVYLNIAAEGSNAVVLTMTGDNAGVAAIVAFNFAAIAADEARAALIIDTNTGGPGVTTALGVRGAAGVSGMLNGSADWTDVSRTVRLGRDRTIEVVATGEGTVQSAALVEMLARDGERLARRYDAIVLVSSMQQVADGVAAALPLRDVVLCVRAGQTSMSALTGMIEQVRASGAQPRGVVLWDAPDPAIAAVRPSAAPAREAVSV